MPAPTPLPPSPAQLGLAPNELVQSLGDVAISEDSKRELGAVYEAHCGLIREGLGLPRGAAAAEAEGGGGATGGAAAAPAGLASAALSAGAGGAGAGTLLPASGATATLPEFRGLDWRLHVTVASRAAHEALAPEFALRLGMAGLGPSGGVGEASAGPHAVEFTSDYAALKRAVETLGAAAAGRGTSHAKRVFKFL